MRVIEITEENLNETCYVHLTEPVVPNACAGGEVRCSSCHTVIDARRLPVEHQCAVPEKAEEPR